MSALEKRLRSAKWRLTGLIGQALAISLSPFPIGLPGAANSSRMLSRAPLRGLLVVPTKLHLAVHALALQLLLQRAERLIDVVVANDDLHLLSAFDYLHQV